MDTNTQNNIGNITEDKLAFLKKRKKLVGIVAGFIVAVFAVTLLLPTSSNQNDKKSGNPPSVDDDLPTDSFLNAEGTPGPTHTPELKEAIKEAEKAAEEYGAQQEEVSYDYPWLRKFPLARDNYYVYFDIEKRAFVADIFVGAGGNADQIKSEIQNQIFAITKVPTENFQFEFNIK